MTMPQYGLRAFTCPHEACGVLAEFKWYQLGRQVPGNQGRLELKGRCFSAATCAACGRDTVWYSSTQLPNALENAVIAGVSRKGELLDASVGKGQTSTPMSRGFMVYPLRSTAPLPHEDLPEACAEIFLEARDVFDRSARSAASLLRLCTELLISEIEDDSSLDLNAKIGRLVDKGLRPDIAHALDVLRVVGGNAVHPNKELLVDDEETALALFKLINFVVQTMITDRVLAEKVFAGLPEAKKEAIKKRDEPESPI